MTNAEKIQNLKNELTTYINASKSIDEDLLFTFAKQYVKEMQIEITKGEIKSIIYCIINNQHHFQQPEDLYAHHIYSPAEKLTENIENRSDYIFL